jgi:hypothetical protein
MVRSQWLRSRHAALLARSEPIKIWRLPRCHAELKFERHDDLGLAYSIVIGSA